MDSFVSPYVSTMDEEELQKQFTDCVYFLASPLTCKKGIECDFRHNEIARLNPRDCWYWMGGGCYNPDCAFRHPPLEGLKEAYYESLNPINGSPLPVEKTNVPCYFYSKGFCNKADRCSFLHEPPDSNICMVKNGVPFEKKLSAANNTGSTPAQTEYPHPDPPDPAQTEYAHPDPPATAHTEYTHPEPPETAQNEYKQLVMKHTPDSHQLVSRSESVESEENVEREEFIESEENAVESEEIVVQTESDVYNDQSSDDYVERQKWLDLSPSFDVLVQGNSKRLEYEDDVGIFFVSDEEHRELGFHYSEYNRFQKVSEQSRVSIFDRLSFKKRNTHRKLIFNVRRGSDLRDYLKKSKVAEFDCRIRRNFRPHGPCDEVDFDHRGCLRKAVPVNRYKPPLKKQRFFSSDVFRPRKPAQQQKRESWVESAAFTGPKSLDQIKEEKKQTRENRDIGLNKQTGSDGFFQGPRPLSEILKNKRKLG